MASGMTIGEVARRSGTPATTLRFYESERLLPAPERVGGRRRYDESVLTRLQIIGLCKAAGFSLDEVRLLLSDDRPGRPATRKLAHEKLAALDAQMATLRHARSIIEWAMACRCPSIDDCSCGIHTAPPPEVLAAGTPVSPSGPAPPRR